MSDDRVNNLTDLERWLRGTRAEAERVLADLLDLPGPDLQRELSRRPELRAGAIQLLLPLLAEGRAIQPQRVCELTAVLVAGTLGPVPSALAPAAVSLHGKAWTEHAAALSALGRYTEAFEAIDAALELFRREPQVPSQIADAEVVQAEILHALGRRTEALRTIRRATPVLLQHGEAQRYAEARMAESWMLWDAGNRAAATEVLKTVSDEAEVRGDRMLLAHMSNKIGVVELRRGNIGSAVNFFDTALNTFTEAELTRETAFVHRNYAEAFLARKNEVRALFEYYAMRDDLLADGDLTGAACASVEIVDLLFLLGQHSELLGFGTNLVAPFVRANMPPNALRPWTYLIERANAGELTRDDIADVRTYFQELPLRPKAVFVAEAER
ncbi:MAG TPA: hypothetical protein VFP80_15890 [Thermoanaerobaculia bacterium]|nr:hypothetical protein [Thermoanaerobaculia bacterium]